MTEQEYRDYGYGSHLTVEKVEVGDILIDGGLSESPFFIVIHIEDENNFIALSLFDISEKESSFACISAGKHTGVVFF